MRPAPGRGGSRIHRQACAGLLWNKQFYHYSVRDWLRGDQGMPPPPPQRLQGRNCTWTHLFNRDVISMPDKWEYPWFAAWDHGIPRNPSCPLDPAFAKEQLVLMRASGTCIPNDRSRL